MKLKKLIPLAGIASVAAVAAPLVTSCSNNKGTLIKWIPGEDTPRLDPVERKYSYSAAPTDAGLDSIVKAINDATNDYFDDIKVDPNLFSKDMLKQWETIYKEVTPVGYKWTEASIHVSKVDAKNQTISYETNLKFESTLTLEDEKPTIEINLEAKNIKFKVMRPRLLGGEGTSITPVLLSGWEFDVFQGSTRPGVVTRWQEAIQQDYADLLVDDSWSVDITVDSSVQFGVLPSSTTFHWDHTNTMLNLYEMWVWDEYIPAAFLEATVAIPVSSYLNITWVEER